MKSLPPTLRHFGLAMSLVWLSLWTEPAQGQSPARGKPDEEIRIVALEGKAEISTDEGRNWVSTQSDQVLKPHHRLRTGANSRVTLRWSDQSKATFGPLTDLEVLPSPTSDDLPGLHLWKGIFSFFHRDKPGRIRVLTRGTVAGVEGTEFVLKVEETAAGERATLWMIDGKVQFASAQGALALTNGQQAVAEFGKAPGLSAGFIANNVLQWCFYYPAVLDPRDLPLTALEQQTLGESLAAYRSGDLLAALAKYPAGRPNGSDAERVYYAAILLSVGQVEQTEIALARLPAGDPNDRLQRLAAALRQLIAAVKLQPNPSTINHQPSGIAGSQLSTELLANSYYEQSLAFRDISLQTALLAARMAATTSPEFGFAWARVAELEFSFGRTGRALEALNRSLALAPRNAQALALKGFLLAAQDKTRDALDWFNRALAVDSALGNAWLGRGLCRIRRGDASGGREDLLTAATLEPQRALLRSYLAKAYANAGDGPRAAHELDLAKRLDPADPTAWLYSALLNREENRINPAVDDLKKSVDQNDNRRVYRSGFLLDEDRAVRSSSLANVYQSAGMNEVSVREASRAVAYDYANYSAHLFLSESYNALRDPTRFNLRYETPWFNEWLLANLLSPVGGTPLGQHISQQEYTRFFQRDGLGLTSQTEYRSDGQVREVASQFGRYGNTAYALDVDYQHNDGVRPNNRLERLEFYGTIKHQLTPQDSILFLTKVQNYHSGDNFQYYDPSRSARTNFFYNEYQTPGALIGAYHREWAPGIHTLLLGGRLANDQRLGDQNVTNYLVIRAPDNAITQLPGVPFDVKYRGQFEIWSGELNQIFQGDRQALILGARYQSGTFKPSDEVLLGSSVAGLAGFFPNPPAADMAQAGMERLSGYAYWTWEMLPHLRITPGVAYDWLRYPENHRHPPVTSGEKTTDRVSPKAALTWSPISEVTVRGAYTRSLGGVSYDESYRLEPSQLGGFSQAFRTIMPEALVGSVSAPRFETAGVGLDLSFKTRTYVTLQGERLESDVRRTIGAFESGLFPFFATPSSLDEHLRYHEHSFAVTVNQLVAEEWSFGARYKFTRAELERTLPEVPLSVFGGARRFDEGDLHQPSLFVLYNHPSGWFGAADLSWYLQNSSFTTYPSGAATTTPVTGDEFPQLNLLAGYRFKGQRGEIAIGGLNLTGENYHLNPVNLYTELPRERVFYSSLRLRF